MANVQAFENAYEQGAQRGAERRAHKEAMKEKEFLEKHDNLVKQRDAIQANWSSLKGTPDEAKATTDLTNAEKAIREHWKPDNAPPGALAKFGHKLTDAVRLTSQAKRDTQAKKVTDAGNKLDLAATQRDIASAALSPEQQKVIEARAGNAGSLEMVRGKMKNWLEASKAAGLPEPTLAEQQAYMTELIQQSSGLATKGNYMLVSGKLGGVGTVLLLNKNTGKYLIGGVEVANPEGWEADPKSIAGAKATRLLRGPIVPYAKSDNGWVQQMLDPYTGEVKRLINAVGPRGQLGTQSESKSVDAYGVPTTTSRTTTPIRGGTGNESYLDKIPMGQLTPEGDVVDIEKPSTATPKTEPSVPAGKQSSPPVGSPKTARAPVVATPKPTEQTSNPAGHKYLGLDEDGHIPDTTTDNPRVREKANLLLDGIALKDLGIPSKDSAEASKLARKYGWEQGAFLPRELIQIHNAEQFLDAALQSQGFMKAMDQGMFQTAKMAEASTDPSKENFVGRLFHAGAVKTLTPDEQEYKRLSDIMVGTVSGLSSILRSGRATEGLINRLKIELPSVMSSTNSEDAKARILNLKKEIAMALNKNAARMRMGDHSEVTPSSGSAQPQGKPVDVNALRKKLLEVGNPK